MIDTTVKVTGLVRNHELHVIARPCAIEAARSQVPGIVVAETWAALRRSPWNLDAATVAETLGPWNVALGTRTGGSQPPQPRPTSRWCGQAAR